jgi:hypothetical protein
VDWWKIRRWYSSFENLAAVGFGKTMAQSHAKPEILGHYLLQIFASSKEDKVLTIGDNYGTIASAAMKYGRSCFHFIGPTSVDNDYWNETAEPRIRAVQNKRDEWGLSAEKDFKSAVPGKLVRMKLSSSKVCKKGWADITLLNDGSDEYLSFAAGLRGFIFWDDQEECFRDLQGNPCVVISPEEYLDEIIISELENKIPSNGYLTVMYEKSCVNDSNPIHVGIRLIRIPFEVI